MAISGPFKPSDLSTYLSLDQNIELTHTQKWQWKSPLSVRVWMISIGYSIKDERINSSERVERLPGYANIWEWKPPEYGCQCDNRIKGYRRAFPFIPFRNPIIYPPLLPRSHPPSLSLWRKGIHSLFLCKASFVHVNTEQHIIDCFYIASLLMMGI